MVVVRGAAARRTGPQGLPNHRSGGREPRYTT